MTGEQIIFLVVALFTLGSGLMVVAPRNLVHAAFWLVSDTLIPVISAIVNGLTTSGLPNSVSLDSS